MLAVQIVIRLQTMRVPDPKNLAFRCQGNDEGAWHCCLGLVGRRDIELAELIDWFGKRPFLAGYAPEKRDALQVREGEIRQEDHWEVPCRAALTASSQSDGPLWTHTRRTSGRIDLR